MSLLVVIVSALSDPTTARALYNWSAAHYGEILQTLGLLAVIIYAGLTYGLLRLQSRQGFENKFFQLLRFHHDILDATRAYPLGAISGPEQSLFGAHAFHALYGKFLAYYRSEYSKGPGKPVDRLANEAYVSFFEDHQDSLGHYFRNLYHLIKFIDGSKVSRKDKDFYTHLVRAQMSSDELLLLFYNCYSAKGKEKFYPLVVKYALLENMPLEELVSRRLKLEADDKSLYPAEAYGKS